MARKGVPQSYVRPLLQRWRDEFDWRQQEKRLNAFAQFTTEIDRQNIHFVHVRSPEPASGPTTVPIGLASFGFDFKPPRKFAERDHSNIISWNEYDRGGHWAAHEAPDLLLDDIRTFFRKLRPKA